MIKYFDIAIVDNNNDVMYYEKWIPRLGFIRMSKESYEKC